LAEYHVVGGFPGYCDHLVVYTNGEASVLNNCAHKQKDFQVESEKIKQLTDLFQQFSNFSSENKGSKGPDGLYTKLIFYGQGSNQPKQEQKTIIMQLMNSILTQGKL